MNNLINLKTPKEIANKLLKEKSVAVIFHIRPDGDAIGSAVSLSLGLNELGISSDVFCADIIPNKFNFLKTIAKVKRQMDRDYSAIVCLDCGEITRIGDFSETFARHKNTYNIDHHLSNSRFADINYVCTKPSNSENVYQILKEMGATINKDIADLLLMGIMTDTGGFRHKGTTGETFKIAGELVDMGATPNEIYYNCFSRQTRERAKLYSRVTGKIRYFLDGKFALASVLKADLEETGAMPSDTEGIIDFVMGIEGVEVGSCVLETNNNKFKISFRGRDTDVNAIAGCFGGGGHKLASGCQILGEYEEVVDKICYAVKTHIKE